MKEFIIYVPHVSAVDPKPPQISAPFWSEKEREQSINLVIDLGHRNGVSPSFRIQAAFQSSSEIEQQLKFKQALSHLSLKGS